MLEVILEGRYFWVPFNCIQQIRIEEPADLRDMVWTPSQFTWSNGGTAVGLIPTRYSGSEKSPMRRWRGLHPPSGKTRGELFTGLGRD